MESRNNVYDTPDRHLKLHVSNIQLLASIDSALPLVTLIFNCRQVITAIVGYSNESENTKIFKDQDDLYNNIMIVSDIKADEHRENQGLQLHLIAASVASLCLTLTQLLLACLVMVFLSYVIEDNGHDDHNHNHAIPRRTSVISGIWVVWSGILLIVLVIFMLSMKRFEDFPDKFYLFMLVSEIVLRIVIISYTTLFFCGKCRFNCC